MNIQNCLFSFNHRELKKTVDSCIIRKKNSSPADVHFHGKKAECRNIKKRSISYRATSALVVRCFVLVFTVCAVPLNFDFCHFPVSTHRRIANHNADIDGRWWHNEGWICCGNKLTSITTIIKNIKCLIRKRRAHGVYRCIVGDRFRSPSLPSGERPMLNYRNYVRECSQ